MKIDLRILVRLLLGLTLICSVASCEEIVDAEGLPFEEKLVIHSILFADSAYNYVRISRTLHVNVPFDTAQAYVRDAIGSVSDGTNNYPLEYSGYRDVYQVKGLRPAPGKEYKLSVSWRGLSAAANTSIPVGGSIDSIYITKDTTFEETRVVLATAITTLPSPYSASFEIYAGDDTWFSSYSSRLYGHEDAEADGKVYVRQTLYDSRSGNDVETLLSRGFIYAEGYREYFETVNDGSDDFGNPIPVRWNVEGDAIGLFFGCHIVSKHVKIN